MILKLLPTGLSVFLLLATHVFGSPILPFNLEAEDQYVPDKIESTLRQVTVVMRHGERAPQDTYPNDPYINYTMEPYGWGQLTNQGRNNQFDQGVFLRQRYGHFLGSEYSPEKFWLQCTAVDRTKMSALLEAAGLWKPSEEQSFKANFPWQPVSLYYQPQDEDTLMLVWDTCPKYAMLRDGILELPEVKQVQNDNQELYDELTALTGMKIANPDDVSSLYATLTAEKTMNLALPSWTDDYYPEKLEPLTLYSLRLNVYDDLLKRLKGGPFLKKIVTDMLAQRDGTLEPAQRKMFMYVGHDSTMVTLLDILNIWQCQMPIYNIMAMLELHEDENGYNVQVFLRNSTEHAPYPLTIPGCRRVCPLDKFIKLLKPIIPNDWKKECEVDGDYTPPPAPSP
ncbi:prostatic acid phosphatase-like [Prorops nasuta]|uniref:prostatic acid phosphatase-like n=1 Tax=Prorops nasuta TaxID=863751 RepID=UPI0034CECC17